MQNFKANYRTGEFKTILISGTTIPNKGLINDATKRRYKNKIRDMYYVLINFI